MGNKQPLLRRLTDAMDLPGEPIPGSAVLELLGDSRILMEHHRGIVQYSPREITVTVPFGRVILCGEGLTLTRMTGQQLIISGSVREIRLLRRGEV